MTWQTQKQEIIACSSELEYVTLFSYTREATWLQRLLSELKVFSSSASDPTALLCDNTTTIKLLENLVLHARTKHIEIKHHYIREQVELVEMFITHVQGKNNLADLFTKPLGKMQFEKLKSELGRIRTSHIAPKKT